MLGLGAISRNSPRGLILDNAGLGLGWSGGAGGAVVFLDTPAEFDSFTSAQHGWKTANLCTLFSICMHRNERLKFAVHQYITNALPDSIRHGSVNLFFQRPSEDSFFLLLLAHQRIRGFAFMRYINLRLID